MFKLKNYYLLLVASFFIVSCEKEEFKKNETPENPVLTRIKSLGFAEQDIKEFDKYYLVEGDIIFNKKDSNKKDSLLKQERVTDLAINKSYKIYISPWIETTTPEHSSKIITGINSAILAYNSLQSNLKFSITTNENDANIIITCMGYYLGLDPYSYIPSANFSDSQGNPGGQIQVPEEALINFTQNNQYTLLFAHLLGHTIGLDHSGTGINIPNTPNNDPSSIMIENYLGQSWTNFSSYDIIAIQNLYPNFSWYSSYTGTNNSIYSNFAFGGDKAFYIGSDGIIRGIWNNGSSWSSTWFPSFPKASTTSDLYWSNGLFYVTTDNKLCRIYWNGSAWAYEYAGLTVLSLGSGITCDGTKTYAIRTDGILSASWKSGSSWSTTWFPSFPKANVNSDLYWSNGLFYVTTDNKLCRIYWNGSAWAYEYAGLTGLSLNSGITGDGVKTYAIGTDGYIRASWKSGSSWSTMWFPSFPKAKINSNLAYNGTYTELFYIGQDNKTYRIFWNGTQWSYNVITRTTSEQSIGSKFIFNNDLLFYYSNNYNVDAITFNR